MERCLRRLLSWGVVALVVGAVTLGAAAAPAAKTEYQFVVITHSATIPYWVPLIKGAQDAARAISLGENVKITVRHLGPALFNVAEQVSILENVIQSGVDGIITTLPDPQAFDAPVALAIQRGIPVIGTDTDDPTDNPRLAFVGIDEVNAGRKLGQEIVKRIGTSGKIAIGMEDLGHPALQMRLQGLKEVLDKTSVKYTVLQTSPDLPLAVSTFESYLLANPDARALVSLDATGTTAQGTVIRNLGLRGKVVSGGFDLVPGTLQNIKDGYTQFTLDAAPYLQGYYPVVQLFLYLRYSISPASIDTGLSVVDSSNVDTVIALAQKGYR